MLSEAQIQAAAERIAEALHPKKIILFGSYARGEANEHSDLDLMVIGPSGMSMSEATLAGYRAVGRVGVDVDVLVCSEELVRERASWCSSPIHWALEEGKVLYDA